MLGRPPAGLLAALVGAGLCSSLTWAGPASAQDQSGTFCRLCAGQADGASEAPAAPLRLEVLTRLEFDRVIFSGLGEARLGLSPSGASSLSGAAGGSGARAMPGTVVIRGEPGRAVRVDLPRRVELYGEGRGSLRIDSIVTDLPGFARIGDDGVLSFRFGGDLTISGDSDGAYRGSIEIVVEYL